MRIAINTRNLLKGKMEGFGQYTLELCKRLTIAHPEHEFYFLFDRPFDKEFIFSKNIVPIVLKPPARHPVLWYLWFEISLGRFLNKNNIDVFWSPDGFINLRTDVPQIATIHDINFHVHPKDLPKSVSYFYNRFFPKFSQKATKILTVSNFSKQELIKHYEIVESKISVIYNSADEIFKPLKEVEKHKIKAEITNSKPYFLFVGSLHPRKNLQRLLHGFSVFAKQNMEFDLVVVGSPLWKKTGIQMPEEIKKRVHFTGYLAQNKLALITGSAHALSFLPYYEGFGIPMVEAMKCGVPVLAANTSCLPEIAGEGALYCDPFDIEDIALKMHSLCREEVHSALSKKALHRGKIFSWDDSMEKVWFEINKIGRENN